MSILIGVLAWSLSFALSPAVAGVAAIPHILMLAILVLAPMLLDLALPHAGLPAAKAILRHPVTRLATALAAGTSFLWPPGPAAALLALPWLLFTGLAATCGMDGIRRASPTPGATTLCCNLGLAYLAVGAGALVMSRAGLQPLGFGEPIVLLTAVHFHYTGATLSVLAGRLSERLPLNRTKTSRLLAAGVLLLMPMVATGILLSPLLEILGILVLVVFTLTVAMLLLRTRMDPRYPLAEWLARTAGLALLPGMALGTAYGWGEFTGDVLIPIPAMVSSHGWIQALGFGLCGTLAMHLWASRRNPTP